MREHRLSTLPVNKNDSTPLSYGVVSYWLPLPNIEDSDIDIDIDIDRAIARAIQYNTHYNT